MEMFYTGIGSREAPEWATDFASNIAVALSQRGYTLRSGRAEGMDFAFQRGAEYDRPQNPRTKIYVPNDRFNAHYGNKNAINPKRLPNYEDAEDICSTIHPVFDRLRGFARDAHVRNVYQVLGSALCEPSEFLLCWAKPKGADAVHGGTATAWELARRNGIPRYNFYNEEDQKAFLNDYPEVEKYLGLA
ncbi:hypothetical protein KAMAJI_01330 [Serratia phage vB_SmaM-Kamaji]|nr:hypothetical protein KAMAJI_01330 [Serratia phage vB_SmaM-Kamaji]